MTAVLTGVTEAGIIAAARDLCAAAEASLSLSAAAETARLCLADALELHDDLLSGVAHPGSVWPDLEHEDDALNIALGRAAEDVEADYEALLAVMAERGGEVAA